MKKNSLWFPAQNQIGPSCQPTCEYSEGIFLTFLLTLLSFKEDMWEGPEEKIHHIFEKVTINSYQNNNSTKAFIIGKQGAKYPKLIISGKLSGCFVVEYPQKKFFTRRVFNFDSDKIDKKTIINKINGYSGTYNKVHRKFKIDTKEKLEEIVKNDNWRFELFIFCIKKICSADKKSIQNMYDNFFEYYQH